VIRARRGKAGVASTTLAVLVVAISTATDAAAAGPARGFGAPSADRVVARELLQTRAEVREYWTPERMRAAEPAALELGAGPGARIRRPADARAANGRARAVEAGGDNASFPTRAHGRIFFTIRGGSDPGDFVCSGTVADSPTHTLVWTAGHCVNDAEFDGGFATNWSFVPGYRNGERPFGTWAASDLYTTRGWRDNTNIRVDVGAAAIKRDFQGRGIEDVVGGLEVAFGQPRNQLFTAFGYPTIPTLFRPEFDGERLWSCTSPRTADDNPPGAGPAPMRIDCDMTGGSSGGAWTAAGWIQSVTSYSYAGDFTHLYGPYLGAAAEELFTEAGGEELSCGRKPVTNLGGPGRQSYTGTDGTDSFRLGAGHDRANGGPGRDRLCGGDGPDTLVGGPGRDTCIGGGGDDRARRCEIERQIP
jgi:hypothetical protein